MSSIHEKTQEFKVQAEKIEIDLLGAIQKEDWPSIGKHIDDENIDTKLLLETLEIDGKIFNALDLLVRKQQWTFIEKLIEQDQIPTALLANQPLDDEDKGLNILALLTDRGAWGSIKTLIVRKHITPELLANQSLDNSDPHKGINVVLTLVSHQKWDLFQILAEQKRITTELLASQPLADNHADKGINVVLHLATRRQWNLLEVLIAQRLITTELLASQPLANNHSSKGINVVWYLAFRQQWGLLRVLISQGHITTQLLASQPLADDYPDKGINVVWLLVAHQQWDLIGKLIKQGKITTQLLLSTAQQGDNAKRNVLSFFTLHNRWDLIVPLIPEINTQLLIEEPAPGASFLNRLLNQEPARIINFFKLLLKSPLNPLALVPWEKFQGKTDAVMTTLQGANDLETFNALKKAGVKLPSPKINRLYEKFRDLYKNLQSPPEDKKSSHLNNRRISPITDFHPDSQTAYWHSKALEEMQKQAVVFGYFISEMKDHAADPAIYEPPQGVPEQIIELIQFYASGEQEGVPSLFDNDAFAFTGAIPAKKPLAEVKEMESKATDAKGIAADIPPEQVKDTKDAKKDVSDTKELTVKSSAEQTVNRVNRRTSQCAFYKEHQKIGEAAYRQDHPLKSESKQIAVPEITETKPVSATNKTSLLLSSSAFDFNNPPLTMSSSQTTGSASTNIPPPEPETLSQAETVSLATL